MSRVASFRSRPVGVPSEWVLLAVSLLWVLTCHQPFFTAALQGRTWSDPSAWGFAAALCVGLVALNFVVLALLCHGRLLKPVLAVLLVVAAGSTHFMQAFGVYLDPSMLRNALRTDVGEARELLSFGFVVRLLWTVGGVAVLVGAVMAVFQPFSSLMRNHKAMRYLITPTNVLWSAGSVVAEDLQGAAKPRQPIGLDAKPGPRMQARTRPTVLVVVVGETARAANWGLNGYARQTTPALAKIPALVNFRQVTSCGTNTEVSVPCLFAPVGRRDYDEVAIRGSESLLHVLHRAGVGVLWRDNQSGCKGVCDGLPSEEMAKLNPPGLCADGRCLDEALLLGLDARLAQAQGTQVLVLHQLGNHGPSYFRRYPDAFATFQPACQHDDLRQCSTAEIVNAYDNVLLYTDHVLATLIEKLQARAATVDSAVVYVSDHGESLGEANLFLHGLPYAIAPDVQKQVPMVMWLSDGMAASAGIDRACLRHRATQPAAHDHLFHTVLGLADVRTALYAPEWDLLHGCRKGSP